MLELETIPPPTLTLIANLLDALHEKNILYCHWKGHEPHLIASMKGDSDLDILFDLNQKEKLEPLLHTLGFKKFETISQKRYKDIVDFIGFDSESGKLIHLHTHYRLTMGELYLKGYQPDLEKKILETRFFNDAFGTYCIHPALQFITLYLIESLKLRNRDIFSILLRNKTQCSEKILQEYYWLNTRVTNSEIYELLTKIFKYPAPIYRIITGNFNRKQLRKLAPFLKIEFVKKRLYSPVGGLLLRWYREVTCIFGKKLSRLLAWPIPTRRTNPRGGTVVAVIGADGSGKSTVVADLKKTFGVKLDIYSIYFGRGDGDISWGRKRLQAFKNLLFQQQKNDKVTPNAHINSINSGGFLRLIYKCTTALLVACEKNGNLNRLQIAKKKGMIIICDRYPQNQIMGYNDGPLLHHLKNSGNPLIKAFANREATIYRRAESMQPDIVFKLIADANVVEKRKPGETSIQKLEAKIAGIKQLQFSNTCKVVEVDTSKPLHEVLATVKNEIWNIL